MKELVPAGVSLKNIQVWFQDEARFGQRNNITRVWAEKGTRPRLKRQQQYEYSYLFGAVCAQTQQAVGLIFPIVNTHTMQIHLNEISKQVKRGKHAVVILDKAAWHTTKKLEIPNNISLLHLPPYSPELNPVEQVWSWLRQHFLSNRVFEGYEDIENSCSIAWNNFANSSEVIASISNRKWVKLLS